MKHLFESEDGDHQLFFVTSYSDFDKLGKIERGSWCDVMWCDVMSTSQYSLQTRTWVSNLLLLSFLLSRHMILFPILLRFYFDSPRPPRHRSQKVSLRLPLSPFWRLAGPPQRSGRCRLRRQSGLFSPPSPPECCLYVHWGLSREWKNHCL